MKILFSALLSVLISFGANDCPTPSEATFMKVLNPAFAKEYEKCPVIIHCIFMASNVPKTKVAGVGFSLPGKIKGMVHFMCLGEAEQPAITVIGEPLGEIMSIAQEKSDMVFSLKKGDKIKLIGIVTFISDGGAVGGRKRVYFNVSSIEKE